MGAYCVAIDPGGTTGIAVAKTDANPWTLSVQQLTGQHHLQLLELLYKLRPDVVVCESFENRGIGSAILEPREYIGVVKVYLQETRAAGVWQSASTGKAFWTDERLQRHNLYFQGARHARDAVRHYAHWRTFTLKDRSLLERKQRGLVIRLPNSPNSTEVHPQTSSR